MECETCAVTSHLERFDLQRGIGDDGAQVHDGRRVFLGEALKPPQKTKNATINNVSEIV